MEVVIEKMYIVHGACLPRLSTANAYLPSYSKSASDKNETEKETGASTNRGVETDGE